MATKVRGIDEQKLFKIGRFNLQGKSKDWYKKLATVPTDWPSMKVAMLLKYGMVDKEYIQVKLDQIKQEPKQKVEAYHDKMEKLFIKGKLEDTKQRKRLFSKLQPQKTLCVMRDYVKMDELFAATLEIEKVLAELGETPYELLKEEQKEEL